jgi:MFS family permease
MSDSTQTLPRTSSHAAISDVHRKRLLWAGFMAILSTGVGFAIRGGIFANWGAEYGFTGAQLGEIGGAGLTGFCFGVIIGGVIADKIGYGKLVCAAFLLHIISAVVTFATSASMPQASAYACLYWGMFIFALANGTLEAVANPLVATLFPENRTHYLNILHASWPLGLMIGGIAGAVLGGALHWGWKAQLSLYLVATVLYGIMFFGQKFPKSEASQKGLSLGEMFKDVGILGGLVICFLIALFFHGAFGLSNAAAYGIAGVLLIIIGVITRFSIGAILLFVLFATHALVGAVELGTDQWIQNITGNILTPTMGKWLFVYTSLIMFLLRFCAHFIEKNLKLSPVGLLAICAATAAVGLNLISISNTTGMIMLALAVYAGGKTFFWPTMLAVASDRFPRTGAIAISIMGGIGMMSAGMIGAPGLGYAKDRFAGEDLAKQNPAIYQEYKADKSSSFLPFIFGDATGLDGKKLAAAKEAPKDAAHSKEAAVTSADLQGDRKTLKADSAIPITMAAIYILIAIYFKSIGGYKIVHLQGTSAAATSGKDEVVT